MWHFTCSDSAPRRGKTENFLFACTGVNLVIVCVVLAENRIDFVKQLTRML